MKKNYFKNLMQVSLLLGAAFVISSCDDVIGQEDNPVASYVQWQAKTPEEVTLKIGNTYTVKATAVSSAIIVYESENPEIAKVNPVTGVITAVAVGETNINAVVTGISTTGQSVFTPEKVSIKVIVRDGKAKLTRTQDEVIEYTANKDSVIDLSKLFTAYPEATTKSEKDKSTISYTVKILNKKSTSTDKYEAYDNTAKLGSNAKEASKFEVGPEIEQKNYTKAICDTLYVIGQIKSTNGSEYTLPTGTTAADLDIVMDTVKVIINKSIAFINKDGKREILTADKYKTPDFKKALEAGTYYIPAATTAPNLGDLAVKGDVTLIFADGFTGTNAISGTSISDQTDKATLNIFGEAIKDGAARKYKAASPTINVKATAGDAISNFAEINFYTGAITATSDKEGNGAFVKVKNLNVFGGTLTATKLTNKGFAISLLKGGKLTVKGGTVKATGFGSDVNLSYGVIGDVEVLKGDFEAKSDYRAVNGSLTAGEGLEFVESNDPTATSPTWTKITGTTSNAKGIKSQKATKK